MILGLAMPVLSLWGFDVLGNRACEVSQLWIQIEVFDVIEIFWLKFSEASSWLLLNGLEWIWPDYNIQIGVFFL